MEDIKYTGFYLEGNVIKCYEGYDRLEEFFIEKSEPKDFVCNTLENNQKEEIIVQMQELISDYKNIIKVLKK